VDSAAFHSKPIYFSNDYQLNKLLIEERLGGSIDLEQREFCSPDASMSGVYFYIQGLADSAEVANTLKSLLVYSEQMAGTRSGVDSATRFQSYISINSGLKLTPSLEDAILAILSGDTVILLQDSSNAIIVSTRGWNSRSVDEPATENVVRGPRDGFTESIRTNTASVRRRIRDSNLRLESMVIGAKTQTEINIAYIEGVVKEGLVQEVRSRLQGIRIDAVLESGYIEELIEDSPLSIFNTIQSTERPDKVAAALLEGRVAIFVDNTPFVLILPTFFWQSIQAPDDYYSRYYMGSFFRMLRYFAYVFSFTLSALYVMIVSFHQEMIPTGLALTIASGREVVPFPVLIEALMMEFAFELMREAGLRMPKPIGSAVSIVGSLIIGQAAVQAGLVSPTIVIIVAITGLASFSIPNYNTSFSIRLLRFPLLIASGTLGLLGFVAVVFAVLIHALSIRSFGEPYMAPASPFRPSDQKDIIIRVPWWKMKKRPTLANGTDNRIGPDQMPEPPESQDSRSDLFPPIPSDSSGLQAAEPELLPMEQPTKNKQSYWFRRLSGK
jgi:spore germination protein KA